MVNSPGASRSKQSLTPGPGFWQTYCRTTTITLMKECTDYWTVHLVVGSTVRFDVVPAKSAHYISMAHHSTLLQTFSDETNLSVPKGCNTKLGGGRGVNPDFGKIETKDS